MEGGAGRGNMYLMSVMTKINFRERFTERNVGPRNKFPREMVVAPTLSKSRSIWMMFLVT